MTTDDGQGILEILDSIAETIECGEPWLVSEPIRDAAAEIRRLATLAIEQAHAIATLQEVAGKLYEAWEDGDDGMGGGDDLDDDDDDDLDTDDDMDDEFRPPDDGPWAPLPGQMSFLTPEDDAS